MSEEETKTNEEILASVTEDDSAQEATQEAAPATPASDKTPVDEQIEKMVAQRTEAIITEQLKEIKGKLDSAYEARDEAVKKAAIIESEKKQEQIAKLEDEGKHKEVYDLRLAELEAKLESAEKHNIELTRNATVREAISGLQFRNDSAGKMAYNEIVSELVQDEHGRWVHLSGTSIGEFVDSYSKDEEKTFLFKPKNSSGSTMGQPSVSAATAASDALKSKKVSEMTPQEILEAASAGQFGDVSGKLF